MNQQELAALVVKRATEIATDRPKLGDSLAMVIAHQQLLEEAYQNAMTEERAREILGGMIGSDEELHFDGQWICWDKGDQEACLDGRFTADQLEAIAWWMRNK